MDWTTPLAWMGLGFFWVHTLLMAAHAGAQGAALGRRLRVWASGGLRRARVVEGAGVGRQLAVHRVEQTGRSKGDPKIHFHDRAYHSELEGGALELEDGVVAKLPAGGPVEVWIDPTSQRARADVFGESEFESAHALARKARGFSRVLEHPVCDGDEVWFYGVGEDGAPLMTVSTASATYVGVLVPSPWTPVIATFDPRPWLRGRMWVARLAALGIVTSAVVVTAPMFLWEPFGLEAKLGALGAVIVFNLQQLALKMVRDYTREPSQCHVRGCWRGAAGESTAS